MTPPFKRMAPLTKLVIGCVIVFFFGIIFYWLATFFHPMHMELGGERFTLQTAVTETERERGLGGRESLCKACAMLFVFETPGRYAFWMKDMRFSIDIIWLSHDRVVFVAESISPDFTGILDPPVIADRVIELSAGAAKNVTVGEKMRFSY